MWTQLNKRGKIARCQAYFLEGRALIGWFSPSTVGIALLVLDKFNLSLWYSLIAIPILLITLISLGYYWRHYGWLRQFQEVSTIDSWNKLNIFQANLQLEIAKQLKINVNLIDSDKIDPKIMKITASNVIEIDNNNHK